MNGKTPKGCTEPITVKFANNPSNNGKALPGPLAAYLTPQATRRLAGGIPAGRFRLEQILEYLFISFIYYLILLILLFAFNSCFLLFLLFVALGKVRC